MPEKPSKETWYEKHPVDTYYADVGVGVVMRVFEKRVGHGGDVAVAAALTFIPGVMLINGEIVAPGALDPSDQPHTSWKERVRLLEVALTTERERAQGEQATLTEQLTQLTTENGRLTTQLAAVTEALRTAQDALVTERARAGLSLTETKSNGLLSLLFKDP